GPRLRRGHPHAHRQRDHQRQEPLRHRQPVRRHQAVRAGLPQRRRRLQGVPRSQDDRHARPGMAPHAGDVLEIENLLTRYRRAVDAKDWELYRSMFTDGARVDYSAAGLFVGTCDDAVAYLARHQEAISVGMHYVTNIESRIDGDSAEVVATWFNTVALPHKS